MSIKLYARGSYQVLEQSTFPGGERHLRIVDHVEISITKSLAIEIRYESSVDLIDLVLLVDAVRRLSVNCRINLYIPYFPYARQDRCMQDGEAASLHAIAAMINSLRLDSVVTWDPHSYVLENLFAPGVLTCVSQSDIWGHRIPNNLAEMCIDIKSCALLSPDAGAAKKIDALAKRLGMHVYYADKYRENGQVVPRVSLPENCPYKYLIVVDDICDGGATFVSLAKAVMQQFDGQLMLCVTHGIFSKGIDELSKYYHTIIRANAM